MRSTVDRRERPHLLTARPASPSDKADWVVRDQLGLERSLQDAAEQLERVPNRDGTATGREPVGLPAGDYLRAQLPELQGAEVGCDVVVVEMRIVLPGPRRQRDGIRRRPYAGDEVIERLATGVEVYEATELPASDQLGVVALGVPLAVEGAGAVAAGLPVANDPLLAFANGRSRSLIKVGGDHSSRSRNAPSPSRAVADW